jgi:hypothetical protein
LILFGAFEPLRDYRVSRFRASSSEYGRGNGRSSYYVARLIMG